MRNSYGYVSITIHYCLGVPRIDTAIGPMEDFIGAHQTNGATVNDWMRGPPSAGFATFASPAPTVSNNNVFSSPLNVILSQQKRLAAGDQS